jgi:hypothetical protein
MLLHHNWNLRRNFLFHHKWKLKVDVSSNLCGLKLTRMTICNIDWEFRSNNDGLNCSRIYIH